MSISIRWRCDTNVWVIWTIKTLSNWFIALTSIFSSRRHLNFMFFAKEKKRNFTRITLRHFDDFIHDDLMKFFFCEYNEFYYFVVWICDKIKNFQMIVLIIKNKTCLFFNFFFNHIEHERNKCIRFRIDNDDEFMKNEFKNWREFREIRIEFFIVDNFQMNDCIERLNQTLMRKVNVMLKNFELSLKCWSKLVKIVKFLRIIFFIIDLINDKNESIIFYEISIDHLFNYRFFRRINKKSIKLSNFSLITKNSSIIQSETYSWAMKMNIFIVWINFKSQIKRFSNVEWLENKRFSDFIQSFRNSSTFKSNAISFATKSFAFAFAFASFFRNDIDQFFDNLKLKLFEVISTFKKIITFKRVSFNNFAIENQL